MGLPCNRRNRYKEGSVRPELAGVDPLAEDQGLESSAARPGQDTDHSSQSDNEPIIAGSRSDRDRTAEPYVIPMRREPGTPGLHPRTKHVAIDESQRKRPTRSRRKPVWMDPKDWVLSQQQHTFLVDPESVVYL